VSDVVIVVTGPGRSGTSALARIYQELGFDPGGRWIPDTRAGLEHGEFWRLNNRLMTGVQASMLHPPRKFIPTPENPNPKRPKSRVRLIDWDRFDAVVSEYRDTMLRLSRETPFVKDPRFMWTLPMWIAAGAQLDHVVITVRAMDDMVASRHAAGHSEFDRVELRNSLTYGLGVITAAVHEHDVSHSVIRFPDFLHDMQQLYDALVFPEPVDFERFRKVAEQVIDHSQVHDWSAGGQT
jgi:hypothetical protein